MSKKFFLLIISSFCILVTDGYAQTLINVPVANMYQSPSADSALSSQTIYNSQVQIIAKKDDFSLITDQDGYQGWIQNDDIVTVHNLTAKHIAKVTALFANIYRVADTTKYAPIMTVPFATQLPIDKAVDERWVRIRLLNGNLAWIQQGDINIDPKPLTMGQMLVLSRKFVGLPYMWGGTTTYGIDCSAFVQMLYQQMGVLLPRDASQQLIDPCLKKVAKKDLQPGDLMYFGFDGVVSHAGIYLGNGKFVNSTAYKYPIVQISDLNDEHWKDIYITARHLRPTNTLAFYGKIEQLSTYDINQMRKFTWHKGCPVGLNKLVKLRLSFWGFDNKAHRGELIVNKYLAQEILDVFKELFQYKFPIGKMHPMYFYKGDDLAAMNDNNTSAFNCRAMTDFPGQFSIHSYGGAIDINTLINPYVQGRKILPMQGKKYLARDTYQTGKILPQGLVVAAFARKGWIWGGSWPNFKDYQHFEKPLSN